MNERELLAAFSANVEDGTIEIVGVDEDGEFTFRLTEIGEQRVKALAAEAGVNLPDMKGKSFAEFMEAMGFR